MAKKSRGEFNMSLEIRNLVAEHPELTGTQIVEKLKEKFPKQTINEASAKVAAYSARQKAGVATPKKKKGKPGPKPGAKKQSPAASNMDTLQAAARFITQIGDADTAVEAVKQVKALQVK